MICKTIAKWPKFMLGIITQFLLLTIRERGAVVWTLEEIESVVISHSEILTAVHSYLRKTDYFWNWFIENESQLATVLNLAERWEETAGFGSGREIESLAMRVEEMERHLNHDMKQSVEVANENHRKEFESLFRQVRTLQDRVTDVSEGADAMELSYNKSLSKLIGFSQAITENANISIEKIKNETSYHCPADTDCLPKEEVNVITQRLSSLENVNSERFSKIMERIGAMEEKFEETNRYVNKEIEGIKLNISKEMEDIRQGKTNVEDLRTRFNHLRDEINYNFGGPRINDDPQNERSDVFFSREVKPSSANESVAPDELKLGTIADTNNIFNETSLQNSSSLSEKDSELTSTREANELNSSSPSHHSEATLSFSPLHPETSSAQSTPSINAKRRRFKEIMNSRRNRKGWRGTKTPLGLKNHGLGFSEMGGTVSNVPYPSHSQDPPHSESLLSKTTAGPVHNTPLMKDFAGKTENGSRLPPRMIAML